MMTKPTKSQTEAATHMKKLIAQFRPDFVITEKIGQGCRKGAKAKLHIHAIQQVAVSSSSLDICVERIQRFANKYEEAESLAMQYRDIADWVPKKRRHFDPEPDRILLFEALALASEVLRNQTATIAKALG